MNKDNALTYGSHAQRPTGPGEHVGALYLCTTHRLVYQTVDGGRSWASWGDLTASAGGGGDTPTLAEVLAVDSGATWDPTFGILSNDANHGIGYYAGGDGSTSATGAGATAQAAGGGAGGAGSLYGGDAGPGQAGGTARLVGGYGDDGSVQPATLTAGSGQANGAGGSATITGGNAHGGSDQNGGDITLTPGAKNGAGRNGLVFLNLPTSDPAVAGALYTASGTVKVSAG